MKFINDDFLLHSDISKKIYHNIADKLPIIDYHCHLDPKIIAEDKIFEDISEIWLLEDHYKWRAMRANGISEENITGKSSNKEKFKAWAKTLENCIGNPLYHWSALELKRYFDIDDLLNEENSDEIWEKANKVIKDKKYSPKKIISMSNVKYICTTDSPLDDLKYHEEIAKDKEFNTIVAPGFRPDPLFVINSKYYDFLEKLEKISSIKINSYDKLIEAIYSRINYFHERNCKISDHGLSNIYFEEYNKNEIDEIYLKILNREKINILEEKKYLSSLWIDLSKKYKQLEWTMQLHFGAIRNNDESILKTIGVDAGCDSMIDQENIAQNLNKMLSNMKKNNALPKFIIYNLEPSKNHLIANTLANFSSNLEKGYLQFGAAWWFNDTKEGMLRQLNALADQGLIMNFIGMLTDSRSFISYIRHEYFRRILCEYIGNLVTLGEIPNDDKLLEKLIGNISYYNALKYFKLKEVIK